MNKPTLGLAWLRWQQVVLNRVLHICLGFGTTAINVMHFLHTALAETAFANHYCHVMCLQRTGDNLAGAGTALIDEHHGWNISKRRALSLRRECVQLLPVAILNTDNSAGAQERIDKRNRALQQSARVTAQIQDQTVDITLRGHLAH